MATADEAASRLEHPIAQTPIAGIAHFVEIDRPGYDPLKVYLIKELNEMRTHSWEMGSSPLNVVTGFSLFVLGHHFARRWRAMARSLARQVGCEVPLTLTVFSSRAEDAELLSQGLRDGPSPPPLELEQIPEERIMQRALHFAWAHERHTLSHTVFCDADLWFPPVRPTSSQLPGRTRPTPGLSKKNVRFQVRVTTRGIPYQS